MLSPHSSESEGQLIASELPVSTQLRGEDEKDTALLRGMAEEASHYISSFSWCMNVLDQYFAGGVGGIFAIFFFRIQPARADIDPWIWVMVGDVPPAYLPVTDCKSSAEAFRLYVAGMRRWCEVARRGTDGMHEPDIPPVNVPATPEWAEQLSKRLRVLEFAVKPFFETDQPNLQ